ncbi:MAG TPA: acetylornithine deacetylase [Thermoanaerobaculia bacterium]|nr:acetylornithine deacetylase [Thermoanaerobaculia bacterium]
MATALSDTELLARLVAFDSTSARSNLDIADFLAGYLDGPGARIDRFPSADGEKVNLVVETGPSTTEGRQGLVLSAHMDVVPAGAGWSHDPFTLTDGGDRYFGRGSADMKGFLALAANAFNRASATVLTAPLALVLTYDEEVGCLGAQRLVAAWPKARSLPRATLVGEPTRLKALTRHKGHLTLRLTFRGVSAHSGYPHLGRSAVEPAAEAVAALSRLRRQLAAERPEGGDAFPETPYVALNVGRIEGGEAVNVIPDRCVVEMGLRLLPGMAAEPWVERVQEAIAPAVGGADWHLEVLRFTPALATREDAAIVRHLKGLLGQEEILSASYATDGGRLSELGLEPVICGPGDIAVAHKPDEYLPKADLEAAARLVDRLITDFCHV